MLLGRISSEHDMIMKHRRRVNKNSFVSIPDITQLFLQDARILPSRELLPCIELKCPWLAFSSSSCLPSQHNTVTYIHSEERRGWGSLHHELGSRSPFPFLTKPKKCKNSAHSRYRSRAACITECHSVCMNSFSRTLSKTKKRKLWPHQ